MDLRMLESLQRAIPVVLRHLDAYVELAERDLAQASSAAASKFQALLLLGVSVVFALFFACLLIIAMTWDGEYRLAVIGSLTGLFALSSIACAAWFLRKRAPPFATLREEWREDRALIRHVLAQNTDQRVSEAT